MSERSQFWLLGERRFLPFRRIGLVAGEPVPAAAAAPAALQAQVLAMRGDWK